MNNTVTLLGTSQLSEVVDGSVARWTALSDEPLRCGPFYEKSFGYDVTTDYVLKWFQAAGYQPGNLRDLLFHLDALNARPFAQLYRMSIPIVALATRFYIESSSGPYVPCLYLKTRTMYRVYPVPTQRIWSGAYRFLITPADHLPSERFSPR